MVPGPGEGRKPIQRDTPIAERMPAAAARLPVPNRPSRSRAIAPVAMGKATPMRAGNGHATEDKRKPVDADLHTRHVEDRCVSWP